MIVVPDEVTPDEIRFDDLIFKRSECQHWEMSGCDLLFEEMEAIAFELPWPATIRICPANEDRQQSAIADPPSVLSIMASASHALRACEKSIAERIAESCGQELHSPLAVNIEFAAADIDLSLASAVAELLDELCENTDRPMHAARFISGQE